MVEGTKIVGYMALVRLANVSDAVMSEHGAARKLLAEREKGLWARCVTRKRKTQFLAGRIAAKLASNMLRTSSCEFPKPLDAIEIYPEDRGRPICRYSDGSRHSVSISHCDGLALAAVELNRRPIALDIEGTNSRVRPTRDMFHEFEMCQIRDLRDARLRWTLKEVVGKLTGLGILGYSREVITLSIGGRLWLVTSSSLPVQESSIVAAGNWHGLTVAVGMESAARD